MKNYFYSNQLAQQIKQLLNDHMSADAAKNITVGDFSVLPAPKELTGYLPAVVVSVDELENKFANESMNILYSPYYFTIYYIYPYTFEGDNDAVRQGKQYAEEAANVLMNFRTLNSFTIARSETEAGGLVVYSLLSSVRFESAEQEFFRALDIPAHIASIEFCVGFRTYSG